MEQCTPYETEEQTQPKRSSSSSNSSNSILLPDICIFCDKSIKYKNRRPEPFRKCEVKQVREKIDYRILSLLSTHDIVAAEAKYHHSCYVDYTRPKKTSKPKENTTQNQEYKRVELEVFHLATEYCYNNMTQSKVFKFQEIAAIMTEHIRKNNLTITQSTKKNLRRNVEKSFEDNLKFLSVNKGVFVYPSAMEIEQIIKDLLKEREKISHVEKTAKLIRNEIKEMKDEMPWPP